MDTFAPGTVASTAVVSPDATIAPDATIGHHTVVHAGVEVGAGTFVGSHCVLGEPTASFYAAPGARSGPEPCVVGAGSVIRSHSVLYEGARLGDGCQLGHRVTIREGSVIGTDVRIGTSSDLQGDLTIGDHVRLHSNVHIGQLSLVEDFVWIFPGVVLTNDPHPPSDTCTRGAVVRRYAVIAVGATVLPGIEIGQDAFVGAMSLVNRDVGAEDVVTGVPARRSGSVRDIRCTHGNLEQVYPWRVQFRRGYPDGVLPGPDAT